MKRVLPLFLVFAACDAPRSEPQKTSLQLSFGELVVRAPAFANGALHVERSPGVFVDVESLDAREVSARRVDGRAIYDNAFEGTRVVHLASPGRTEELRYVAHRGAFSSLRYRVRLGPELERLVVVDDYVEALDRNGVARLRTEPAYVTDAHGTKRWMSPRVQQTGDAWSLEYAIDDADLEYPLAIDPAWTVTTALAKARRDHRMELLASGKVLALGGLSTGGNTSSVEIWDPATSSWTGAGNLASPRGFHGSLLLPSGKVLIVGNDTNTVPSAEIYDPATKTSSTIANPTTFVGLFVTLTPLADGTVLVIGSGAQYVLNVATTTWTPVPLTEARDSHVAIPIAGGKILVAGGLAGTTSLSSAEIFNPTTKTWSAAAPMSVARTKPAGQPLPGGKALVAGGQLSTSFVVHSSAEIYDPSTNKWMATPPMKSVHSYTESVVLPSNRVLVMGGDTSTGLTDLTDLYDPTSNTWALAGRLSAPRDEFPAVVLPGGKVLISGGSGGSPTTITQVFVPMTAGQACIGDGECASGFCVDGACCEKSACAAGETCAGTGAAGKCAKKDGVTCATDAECGSAHCVDGVCCNSACTDQCAACDITGKVGVCIPVAAGDAPHGSRKACDGEGACRARCGGVDPTRCTQLPGTAITCAEATCKDGVESRARGCDAAGGCAMSSTRECAPYACGATACKTQCEVDADCAEGNSCDLVSRKCVIASKCDGDHTVTSPEGKAKDCAPFKCNGARCLDTCEDSTVCAGGFVCDTAAKKCVPGATDTADEGGCTYGASSRVDVTLLVLLGLVAWRRRRAERPIGAQSRAVSPLPSTRSGVCGEHGSRARRLRGFFRMRCSRVLAPVDLSEHAYPAARLASSLARHDEGALTLLFVDQLPEFAEAMAIHAPGDVFESYLHDRDAQLTHALGELGDTLGGGSVQTAVARDDVAVAIVDRAVHDACDLVVLGAHRAGTSAHLAVGNVVAEVASRAPCPVLVVRESASHPRAEEPFRRPLIVAPLHLPALAALSLAQAISRPDARIEVVFVDEEHTPNEFVDADQLREKFEAAARPLDVRGVSTSMLWTDGADVVGLLLERIETGRHDVVLVEKTPAVAQPAIGTVARQLLDRAPLPLAIIAAG